MISINLKKESILSQSLPNKSGYFVILIFLLSYTLPFLMSFGYKNI